MKRYKELQEAWMLNHVMNLRLLNAIPAEDLETKGLALRSRNVRRIWIHIHHTRLNWMGAMLAKPPIVARLRGRAKLSTEELSAALLESSNGILAMLKTMSKKRDLAPFQGSRTSFLAMMVAHEAHHRGQILATMRAAGKPIPHHVRESLWDWNI